MSNNNDLRHYEIVLMFNPNQSDKVEATIERYKGFIQDAELKGTVHRFEDWGKRKLAYPINDLEKAHYILMNVECSKAALDQITNALRFNEAVIRHLVLNCNEAITEASAMLTNMAKEKEMEEQARIRKANAEQYQANMAALAAAENSSTDNNDDANSSNAVAE